MHVILEALLVLEVAMHLIEHELLGDRDVEGLEQLVDDLVASLGTLSEDLGAAHLLTDVGLELVDRVELAGDLGEVVVGLGKLALLDGQELHGDLGRFALVVAAEELRLEDRGLARAQAVEGFVDAVDQVSRSDLVGDGVRGVDLLAVDDGDQVDLREVTGLGWPVNGDEGAEASQQVLELGLHLVIRHLDGIHGELEAVDVRQREVGANIDLDDHLEIAGEVLDVRQFLDVGLRAAERADLLLLDGQTVELVEPIAHRVVEHLVAADALVDDGRRNLALAEAGNGDRLGDVAVGVIDAGLEFLRSD